MTASSSDMPRGVRTLDDRRAGQPPIIPPTPTPAPAPAPPVLTARDWFAARIAVDPDFAPSAQHIAWLAAQRAIVACEMAQKFADIGKAESATAYLAVADQYRQIAVVCAERAGITSPRPPETAGPPEADG